ncbi:agouti-related protein isoform X2 [Brienomyrus brachyistius]|uniref:agouti-related protein isoform X2 n=1 Tax=Brienomyrus brachyistius TaxID=42636 RepID=UPI0020B25514|nr:agouti-related protein isoform X2 [Brienomyrus brachyistius]
MWNSVLLYWLALHGFQLATGAVHGSVTAEEHQPGLLKTVRESPFLSDVDEELMVDKAGDYDEEQDVFEAVNLQNRAIRSPRRCFRHQESCLGHQLPCCDPCDTCYCRFFNAICYCRRISQACLHGRH